MSASLPRQTCARQGASSPMNRATGALRHEARQHRSRQGTGRRLVPLLASERRQAVRFAHGRRAEPVARACRLETQPRRLDATREHSTEQNSGEAGNERHETHPFACRGGSPLAAGRAAGADDGELLRSRNSLLRRTSFSRVHAHVCSCMPLLAREPPNVGHERRLEACEARWKTSARWKG